MAAQIRPNRLEVTDRFPVLGFTIRTDGTPQRAEVVVSTDPTLFRSENKSKRTPSNFYSTRAGNPLIVPRGEAVYILPSEILVRFVGQERLYFALATTIDHTGDRTPSVDVFPTERSPYISLKGLTGRALKRVRLLPNRQQQRAANYGTNGLSAFEWAGDTAVPGMEKVSNGSVTAPPGSGENKEKPAPNLVDYDDGFGELKLPSNQANPGTSPSPSAAESQSYYVRAAHGRQLSEENVSDDERGIEGPIPDELVSSSAQGVRAFDIGNPEYPQASRFVLAAQENYRTISSLRTIDRIVIHITDGGANINGTIGWFQNPSAGVSAHYVIGQDGEVVQMVAHNNVAWHARSANSTSIGIEHVANTRGLRPTAAQYCASAALVCWLCDQFGIPSDRSHILGHSEADPRTTHTGCPNAVWGWDHYMGLISSRSCYEPQAQSLGLRRPVPLVRAQEIITPFYDPTDPSTALTCQSDAFSLAREEWFAGVPNTRIFPHSAICQLLMTAPDGRTYQGTGFYIGRNRILTCAHNLHQMSSVTIIPGRNGTGDRPFGQETVISGSWRIAPNYSGSGDWNNDLAVIENVQLAAPNGQWFRFLNATPSDRLPIVVCGYSSGSRAVPELTEAIDGDAQHLHGGYATEQSNLEVIEYPILTLMGASGSPVYHLSNSSGQLEALVCAVHVTGEPVAGGVNRGCFITPAKIDWIEGRTTTFSLSSRISEIPLDPGVSGMSIGVDALKPADIIVSTTRNAVSYAIRTGTFSAVSHTMLYVGNGMVIEAVGSGVREVAIDQAIGDAILAVAYRDSRTNASIAQTIVDYARSRVGNPYNYAGVAFTGYRILNLLPARIIDGIASRLGLEVDQAGSVYCSELVLEAFENAGIPLVASRPEKSAPDDLMQLSGSVLAYVGHLKAEDVPLGIPLGLGFSSAARHHASHAMSGQSFRVHWDTTPYYPQSSGRSCWAACAAMVVGWRDNRTITDAEIADKVPILDAYKTGLFPTDRRALADAWNLVSEPPASYTIDTWAQLLQAYGPLYVDMTWDTSGTGGHARVLVGMDSDGAADGSDTTMYMHDPWPGTPGKIKLQFADFLALYENRTSNEGGYLQYQILHADRVPAGLQSVVAAPFALTSAQEAMPCVPDESSESLLFRRSAPPPPVLEQVQLISRLQAMPVAAVEIASLIAGAVMHRISENSGDISWQLDQLRGYKHPNNIPPDPMPLSNDGTVIRLTDWPWLENQLGDRISAGFEINWQYNGKSVGNVHISNVSTHDAVGWGLSVNARIMDDDIVYPRDNPTFAALKIRFEYHFTRGVGSDLIAIQDVHLFGNGRHNISGKWTQE